MIRHKVLNFEPALLSLLRTERMCQSCIFCKKRSRHCIYRMLPGNSNTEKIEAWDCKIGCDFFLCLTYNFPIRVIHELCHHIFSRSAYLVKVPLNRYLLDDGQILKPFKENVAHYLKLYIALKAYLGFQFD